MGFADTWIYENGILCRISDRELRILDLHHSEKMEVVVDIRAMLDDAVEASRGSRKYKFQLLYCAHDVVSCLYTHAKPDQESWLVVFNARKNQVLTAHRMLSTRKAFVRNNDKFLCYGTFSGDSGRDGYHHWVIKCYDITSDTWLEGKLDLPDMAGPDIGSTVCFEIFDDYFYGLSNQATFDREEIDYWTSYYSCVRFPLNQRAFKCVEHTPRTRMWRRNHTEGPIDDRWTFLKMFKDERTDKLMVVESRKEWLAGSSTAKRTYYTRDVVVGDSGNGSGDEEQDLEDQGSSALFNDPSPSALDKQNDPRHTQTPYRDPHMVHRGDDGSKMLLFTLSKCPIRSYYPSCRTFIDLVDDPSLSDPNSQRIRIRGGTRRLGAPYQLGDSNRLPTANWGESQHTLQASNEDIFSHNNVISWPVEQDSLQANDALINLYNILNPTGFLGHINGVSDERSLVYATWGSEGSGKALVFVSFDPSIFLAGTKAYSGKMVFGRPVVDNTNDEASIQSGSQHLQTRIGQEKGKGVDREHIYPKPALPCTLNSIPKSNAGIASLSESEVISTTQWRKFEPATYQAISRGCHFAR